MQDLQKELDNIVLRTFNTTKIEKAKHYVEDVNFLLRMLQDKNIEINTLKNTIQTIVHKDHERSYNAINEIIKVCSKHGFGSSGPVG